MSTQDGDSPSRNGSSLDTAEAQVAKVFCDLQEQAFTGIVELSTAEGQALFTFDIGDPVFVEDSALRGSLPVSLIEQGIISREQYSTIVRRMTEELVDNEDLRFLEIALELGYLTSDQVFDSITLQLRDKVVEAVSWRNSEVYLEDTRDESSGHARFRVSIGPLILEGIKTHYDEQRANVVLGENALHYVRRRDPTASIAARFELDDAEMRMVYACDGATRVDAAIERSGLSPLRGRQVMCALKLSSSVEFSTAAWDRKGEGESVVESLPVPPLEQSVAKPLPVPPEASGQPAGTDRKNERQPLPPPEKPFWREPPPPEKPFRAEPPPPERPDPAEGRLPESSARAQARPAGRGIDRPKRSPPRAATAATPRAGGVPAIPPSPQASAPRKTAQRTSKRSTLALDRLSRELRKRDVKVRTRRNSGTIAVQELLQRLPQQRELGAESAAAPEQRGQSGREAWTRGWRYLLQQHIPGAREEFRRACELDPGTARHHRYLSFQPDLHSEIPS